VLGEKPIPLQLFPLQILHSVTWYRIRVSAEKKRPQITWIICKDSARTAL